MSPKQRHLIIILISLLLSAALGWLSHDLILGGTILLTGLLSAYFATQGRKIQYLLSIVSYLLMGYAAYNNQLFGSAGFYVLVCAPLQVWGFWSWGKNSNRSGTVKQRKLTFKLSIILIVSCIVGSLVTGFLLSCIPSQRLSFLDAASNCVNLCGIILMSLRYAESWWVWMANNLLDLAIWTLILISPDGGPEAPMMFFTSLAYLLINIYGAIKWWRSSKVQVKAKLKRR